MVVKLIRNRIKQVRKNQKLTLDELGKKTGFSAQKLSRLETGKLHGSFEDFEIIIAKLAKTPEEKYFLATGEKLELQPPKSDIKEYKALIMQMINDGHLSQMEEYKSQIKSLMNTVSQLASKIPDSSDLTHIRNTKQEGQEIGVSIREEVHQPDRAPG